MATQCSHDDTIMLTHYVVSKGRYAPLWCYQGNAVSLTVAYHLPALVNEPGSKV
jgi:hypothetical protein